VKLPTFSDDPIWMRGRSYTSWLRTDAVFHYWLKKGDIPHCQECGRVALVLYRRTPPLICMSILFPIMYQALYCEECAEVKDLLPGEVNETL
jgi:hypothetical protein